MSNKPISVKELFSTDFYRIPIYQRNYAWEEGEVKQLIQDVADYAKRSPDSDYYIGSLVVMYGKNYETIDGQQRLTTLYILLSAIKNQPGSADSFPWFDSARLGFENRAKSTMALRMVYDDKETSDKPFEKHIVSIYSRAMADMLSICEQTNIPFSCFVDYLLHKVKILRIEVPQGINKNHYFEAMNSRGVQLEQHEIVKASLMNELAGSSEDLHLFERIWEACANMEKYMQMNFSPDERRLIFGDNWEEYPCEDFDYLAHNMRSMNDDCEKRSLRELMDAFEAGNGNRFILPKDNKGREEDDDQFYSVINFSNFILHVLKLLKSDYEIALDDKKLSSTFEDILRKQEDKSGFVKSFAICLLKCRFLYDRFIIKRKNEKWSLKKLKSSLYNNSRKAYYVQTFGAELETNSSKDEIIKLLSMFHVSAPTMIYKNWLHASLRYVYNNPNASLDDYCAFLKSLAKTYMLDRYMVPQERRIDFMDIIYKNNSKPFNTINDVDWKLLDQGVAVENFVFNYYDYILWKEGDRDYDFSYRTSVEHFFPQHPSGREPMDPIPLNKFGNLCLISSSTNSSFSNNMPAAKLANFSNTNSVIEQTLKLQDMFAIVSKNREIRKPSEEWIEGDIEKQEEAAIERFTRYLQ